MLAVWVTRYISVGSIAGAVTLAVVAAASDAPTAVAVGAVVSALVIVHRHRANLARLLAGTERRVGHSGGQRTAGSRQWTSGVTKG